jgi:hypothetical protein
MRIERQESEDFFLLFYHVWSRLQGIDTKTAQAHACPEMPTNGGILYQRKLWSADLISARDRKGAARSRPASEEFCESLKFSAMPRRGRSSLDVRLYFPFSTRRGDET